MASDNKTIRLEVSPETLRLIQCALGQLSVEIEGSNEIIVSEEFDEIMRQNVQGLYVQMGEILTDALS